jgi:hypothetical protein
MLSFDTVGLRRLAEIYLMANTPAFLFRQFRADASLRSFARASSSADLVGQVTSYSSSPSRSLEDLAKSYAALVALTLRDTDEVLPLLRAANVSGLDWAQAIIELWLASHMQTRTIEIAASPMVTVVGEESGPATTTENRLEIRGGQ